jgi:NAD(P)-dependent dehydrogenase (short-subunit alcohol dehydrogenase family)|nr:SDR family oxidoreductase [Trebonia sp.]
MTGATAIVTGAGSGIGQAVARRLAVDDLHVLCVDVNGTGAKATADGIQADGLAATACEADVTVAADCARACAQAAAIGQLRVLCNIAGISPFGTGIGQVGEDLWDLVMAVNVKSVYLMSRACLPHMSPMERTSVIVNMASVHAFVAMPESAPYAASKGAIVALTRQMAVDLAPAGIRVVAVAPGAVDTPSSHAGAAALGKELADLFPADTDHLGWLGQPGDVAEAVAWLASAAARFVNGATLVADGGLLAGLRGQG